MESAFQSTVSFPLKDLAILDSGATIHVFNNLSRFSNFQKAPRGDYLCAGSSEVPILGYGDVTLWPKNGRVLRLKNVAFCTDFITNLVSFRLLKAREIYWNMVNNTLFRENDSSIICTLKRKCTSGTVPPTGICLAWRFGEYLESMEFWYTGFAGLPCSSIMAPLASIERRCLSTGQWMRIIYMTILESAVRSM